MENSTTETKCEHCGSGTCQGNCGDCTCPHHRAIPVFIILIAAVLLLGQWEVLTESTVGIVWPILLGAIGVTKFMERNCSCC